MPLVTLNTIVQDGDRITATSKRIIGFGPMGCCASDYLPKIIRVPFLFEYWRFPSGQRRLGLFQKNSMAPFWKLIIWS